MVGLAACSTPATEAVILPRVVERLSGTTDWRDTARDIEELVADEGGACGGGEEDEGD